MLEIIEQFVEGKAGDPKLCEDILHVSDGFVGVIDGSSIKGRTFDGKSSGRFIAEVIDAALSELASDSTMEDGTRFINARIRDAIGYAHSADVMRAGRRPAASCLFLARKREELWVYGDTLLVTDDFEHDLTKKIDHITAGARVAFVRAELLAGRSVQELMASTADMELIEPLLGLQQACFLNNIGAGDLGYGNIDGADEVLHFTRVISVKGVRNLILGSDGYVRLLPTLQETEAELFATLNADPLMVHRYPQVKGLRPGQRTFDDRLYVRLERR